MLKKYVEFNTQKGIEEKKKKRKKKKNDDEDGKTLLKLINNAVYEK